MSKFTDYIGSQFGNPHGTIGRICCAIMNVLNKAMYRKTVSLMKINSGDKILDIGYGNGFLLKLLYKKKKVDMYGIDISEDMQVRASKKNKKAIAENHLHLQVGDCCDLEFEDEMFSSVTSINTVYFWNDTVKGLSEIRRVLKTGKSFYNVVYTKKWLDTLSYTQKGFKKFLPEQLIELGNQAGYKKIEAQEIVSGKSFVVIYTK